MTVLQKKKEKTEKNRAADESMKFYSRRASLMLTQGHPSGKQEDFIMESAELPAAPSPLPKMFQHPEGASFFSNRHVFCRKSIS